MVKSRSKQDAATLRQRAEQRLQAMPAHLHGTPDPLRLLHELQVHQIELEMQNEELTHSNEALRLAACVFSHSHEGIVITDGAMRIVDINPAFTAITGFTASESLGLRVAMLASKGVEGLQPRSWLRVLRREGSWHGELSCLRRDGSSYPARLFLTLLREPPGACRSARHYIGFFSDISQLKQKEDELTRMANYDLLTGLPNRRLLTEGLNLAIQRAQRTGKHLAVCYLDLDGFKPINDSLGHEAGDQLLVDTADRLRLALRANDIIARLGGDEFVLLLTDMADDAEYRQVLDRVLQAVSTPQLLAGRLVRITASIGVTVYPYDDSDNDTLLRHADQAMYLAKQSGKNRYHYYDLARDQLIREYHHQLSRLTSALEQGELLLHYQPKVDLRDGQVTGLEALLRWQHPELGLLTPENFLQVLEGSNAELVLGQWVVSQVLQQMEHWRQQGMVLDVSINISASQLQQQDFADKLLQQLARFPLLSPAQLGLELLETAALEKVAQSIQTLLTCHAHGIRFALDDFGTGYSSLSYFRNLPVDMLKIDQSFVSNMLNSPEDRNIVDSIIRLARAFNREVIAEGVETLAHGAMLLQLDCHYCQGYGIARPMPASAVSTWMQQWQQARVWENMPSPQPEP
ncbi:bifunctional diguanylate cyclase/phosphodiesterase [Aquitalea sp. ASV15]|uniref:putative bifunctional diguanylate cyclase/phosphodiesterase n=1 Tax=Aquitalea sp. ASV15 TaxID=2795104 RepID=UPI0018EB47D4|nr:EAL domain-containing protein [Aquitalea sp. ASV15]